MKQTLLTALLCCILYASALAQAPSTFSGTVKGIVADSTTAKSLSYVTVLVQEVGKTEPIKSTFTREDGSFEVIGLPDKNFQVILTYVGYKSQTIKLPAFTAEAPVANVGKIFLASTANKLKEVEVTTEKLLITQDVDKISYNVDADPESKTLNALDMLRKVPLLTVDAEDNIKLNGNANYKVLINGKASTLFANSPKDVFRSMPANTIKSIDVITTPPAKYEAEGVGGIINIITHKKGPNGYNASVNASLQSPKGVQGGGYLTAKVGKLGFSGYGGTSTYYSPKSANNFVRKDLIYNTVLDQHGESTNENLFRYFSGEFSFELDTLNLFTANFYLNKSTGEYNQEQLTNTFNASNTPIQTFKRLNLGENGWSGKDFGVDYQRTFKKSKDQFLTISYKFSQNGNESFTDFAFVPILNYQGSKNKTENNGTSQEQTFQIDYVQPIKKHALEVGLKSILRDNTSDFYYMNYNPETMKYVVDDSRSNIFNYDQDIYAAYTSLSLKKDKWGLKVGARLEETKVSANFRSSNTTAEQDYFNLIPSATLSRTLPKMSAIKLSYTQRIERPSLYYLNPYQNIVDPKNISFGNPDLKPATSNVFNLAYNAFIKGVSINTGLTHTFTNSSILPYMYLRAEDTVSVTTYDNIGRNQTSGISLSTNATLLKKITMNINGSVNYVQLEGIVSERLINNDGFTANIYGYVSYKFEKNWRASTNVGYYSSQVRLQGRTAGYMFNSVTLSKQFLKDNKASISLNVSSPFQENRRWFNKVEEPGRFIIDQESFFLQRRYRLSFNYRFGKLKGDIARKKRGIKNDDLKSGGDSGGTSN